jgi:hypothetical protein
MKKVLYMFKEMFYLIKKHKLYFLAPILISLVLLAILAFSIGPNALIAFIYAGL